MFAGLQGFEPWLTVLETVVLPLNYSPVPDDFNQKENNLPTISIGLIPTPMV